MVTHRGLANLAAEDSATGSGVTAASRTLHFASPSFDASVFELLLAVRRGRDAWWSSPPDVYGGDELAELLRDERVTHAIRHARRAGDGAIPTGLDDLAVVVVGGEACPPELVARWAPGRRMFNALRPDRDHGRRRASAVR